MKLSIGSGVLLVLIVGSLCVSPISPYNYEDATEDEVYPTQPATTAVTNDVPEPSTESNEPISASAVAQVAPSPPSAPTPAIPVETTLTTKRNLGMPAQVSSRDLGNPPEKISTSPAQQDGKISPPVNEPMVSAPKTNQDAAQEATGQQNANSSSQARGFVSDMISPLSSNQPQQPPANSQQQPQGQSVPPVPAEDLPTIIENNRPVNPNEQANIEQQSEQKLPPNGSANSPQQLASNSSTPTSSARTFDSWTNCVGAQSNKYGTCKNDVECNKSKGKPDGSCMGGFGVCCIVALSCGEKSLENNTFFANPDFPEPSWEARLCEVELKKKGKNILQIMIEFEEFELAPPNYEGECITDVFQVKLSSNKPSPYSLLRICGQNAGQHMYLDVSQIDEPLVLSVATSGGGYPRRWSIRIVQMDEKNYLLAPPGCLQYYTDTVGHFRSFNLGRSLRNLYYAICFRIDNGYSGIRFTENFFGMNGPICRRKIGPSRAPGSLGPYPHHLVIPPPGYAPPPYKPQPNYPVQTSLAPSYSGATHYPGPHYKGPHGRRKRFAKEGEGRYQRTFGSSHEHEHEKDFKAEGKHFRHEEVHHFEPPPPYGPPPTYGPPSVYGPPTTYGPAPVYGGPPAHGYHPEQPYYEPKKVEYMKGPEYEKEKFPYEEKGPAYKEPSNKSPSWGWTSGWSSSDDKKEIKHEHEGKFKDKYAPGYGYQEGYGPHKGYGYAGHPDSYGPSKGYGPQVYEHQGYGYQGYGYAGDYHHKEIDSFGKQYEHLENKHEKNHHGKEHETKSSGGSWWPSWGASNKDDKKSKEKFFQHHEALFPVVRIPEVPHCEPRFCGLNDVITFPPSGDSISEMCGNRFNRGRGPKIISGSPLVVYVSNRGQTRGAGFDMNYEQVFYIPKPY